MSISLEDFSTSNQKVALEETEYSVADIEAAKTSGYEEGYAAGWEDANNASRDAQSQVGAEFARHLQEISFTFHEARAHVLEAVHPVLEEIIAKILPAIIQETIGTHILETLRPLVQSAADQPVTIVVGPGCKLRIKGLLETDLPSAVRIEEEPTLTDGQAFLRIGQVERKIDLTEALDTVAAALGSLGQLNKEVLKHG